MSQEIDLEEKSQYSHTIDRSALRDSSASYPQKEKVDIYCELEAPFSGPLSPSEAVYHLHAQDDFPDGGLRAWLVVLGCSCSVFATFGYVNSFGVSEPPIFMGLQVFIVILDHRSLFQVFQEYYEGILLKGTSPSTIAWIGSTQYALVFFPALISGRLFDIGYFRLPLFIASINLVLCTLLIAECHEYWHFLLCQGFGVGVSCGIVFGPVISIVAHWFKRRRSTAFGIISFASSVGGTVFPVAFRNLNVTIGFKWSMRIIALLLMFVLGIMNLEALFNLKQFKSPAYSVYTASGFVAWLGLYTVLTFIDASAPSQGVSGHLSSYLVAIANAGSGVGRLSCGFIADRIGPLNVMTPSVFVAGILTFLWPHVHGTGALVALALLYGASVGAFAALIGSPMIALGDSTDVGRRTGMYLTILSLGSLIGPPISGAINHATGGYTVVGIYAGQSSFIFSV
ncbi:MFS general substrate transporter [Russula emetica]|nr:MFS general substrate transporter [Russula emetica]